MLMSLQQWWGAEPTLEPHPLITLQAFSIFAVFPSETPGSPTRGGRPLFSHVAITPTVWLGAQMLTA